jgi:hypothetical protein
MHAHPPTLSPNSNTNIMPNEAEMQKAPEALKEEIKPNIQAAADKYNLNRSMLSRRFHEITVSWAEINDAYHKVITTAQELTLVHDINRLSKYGIFVTYKTLTTTVEKKLIGCEIGSYWADRFVERYSGKLLSIYMVGFDREYKIADNAELFKHFYTNISL